MKIWKKIWGYIKEYSNNISTISTITTGLIALSGYVLYLTNWAQNVGLFGFLIRNRMRLFAIFVVVSIFSLFLLIYILNKRFANRFTDNCKGNINEKWDYVGDWRVEEDYMVITNSDEGGISKVGSQWENYTFSFEMKIISQCLGVIVRATDLNNYYMFQISQTQMKIRPHRRVEMQEVIKIKKNETEEITSVRTYALWNIAEDKSPTLNPNLNLSEWHKAEIRVNGESIQMKIDNDIVLTEKSILKIPVGKIGFRNFGNEKALVKKIKLTAMN